MIDIVDKLKTPEECERLIENVQIRLPEMGLPDLAFESVILRYPNLFSSEAVARSKARMAEWELKNKVNPV